MALKVGVIGAGAIGCYVGGKLAAAGGDVVFVGRPRAKEEISRSGLTLLDIGERAKPVKLRPGDVQFTTEDGALADRDVVLVCVKSAQSAEVGAALAKILPRGVIVASLQNGVRNADVLREHLSAQPVLGAVVGFNVVSKGDGVFQRATTGPLAIEASADERAVRLARDLAAVDFEVATPRDIRGVQWSKLIMNLNNAVSALTDAPTIRLVFEKPYRRILAAIMREALAVLRQADVPLAKLGPLPASVFPWMLSLPTPILRLVARVQLQIDPEARSSMWQDLSRGRPTEIDYLNGEIVRLASSCGAAAPLNARVVDLVRAAERAGKGSPALAPERLWRELTEGADQRQPISAS